MTQVLICDDDAIFQINTRRALHSQFEVQSVYNGDEALAVMKKQSIDVLLLDLQMRSPDEGFRFIPKLLDVDPDLAIVIVSATRDFNAVRSAMRLGAADYVVKDIDTEGLVHTLNQVLLRRSLLQRQRQQDFETLTTHRQNVLVGVSPEMEKLRKTLGKLRNCRENILIYGETGTGKELVARQLRRTNSDGSLVPFVAVDSATIQSSMAESILFGHEKGAFTGADKAVKGIFEEANCGIVYFDEIANMPIGIQVKLLRVLQEKEVSRLGSSKSIQLDFQIICATNRDLDEMVEQGEFKLDLLQRINVIPIYIEPLRKRISDIPFLMDHFSQLSTPNFLAPLQFTEAARETLERYAWPGNIRELRNTIAYLSTMADDCRLIERDHLPPKVIGESHRKSDEKLEGDRETQLPAKTGGNPDHASSFSFYERVSRIEAELLRTEYQRHQGNIRNLATALCMDRSHLYTKLKAYGIYSPRDHHP